MPDKPLIEQLTDTYPGRPAEAHRRITGEIRLNLNDILIAMSLILRQRM